MTSNSSRAVILTTLLLGVTACGSPTDEGPIDDQLADICSNPAFASIEKDRYATPFLPWLGEGDIANYDPDLRFIALGEHAGASTGPDDEPLGGLTMFFDEPEVWHGTAGPKRCLAAIVSATLSTTDVRIGTAEEINGKLYNLAEGFAQGESCPGTGPNKEEIYLPSNVIEFFYVSRGRAKGAFCVKIQQVSPESGEPFLLGGDFAIRN